MKILLINHYAGSPRHGMEYRPYYLAREFVRNGHEVTIVAASQSHVRTIQPALNNGRPGDEVIDGVRYNWLLTPPYSGNGISRVRNMLSFVWQLYMRARDLANQYQPDVVIASSTYPLDIYPARRIARLAGARLVFEVHDLWPLSPIELGGMSRWHPFIMLLQRAEDYAYHNVDVVISMLPLVHEHMKEHGLQLEKLCIVPNGIDPDERGSNPVPVPPEISALLERIRKEGWKIVGYTGSHGIANALDTLLDAAHLLKGEKIAIILVGDGPRKAGLMQRVENEGLDNIR
ncbi:MAG TPA: glycosyltransferase WbuB, partial [Chromatiales bacterium]|nr:glycosyltransferase WbuB [Chromatiales bacterium]